MANVIEPIFIVCPNCGYLLDTKKNPSSSRTEGGKECKNCGANVGWSIYGNRVFPYIKTNERR